MQLPNEQGVSKGGMQSHFGMRIRYDIVEIYLSARCLTIGQNKLVRGLICT
jgi:hypothetical protein